jgi:hypothetical protein
MMLLKSGYHTRKSFSQNCYYLHIRYGK